jgi:hypothetical protein
MSVSARDRLEDKPRRSGHRAEKRSHVGYGFDPDRIQLGASTVVRAKIDDRQDRRNRDIPRHAGDMIVQFVQDPPMLGSGIEHILQQHERTLVEVVAAIRGRPTIQFVEKRIVRIDPESQCRADQPIRRSHCMWFPAKNIERRMQF